MKKSIITFILIFNALFIASAQAIEIGHPLTASAMITQNDHVMSRVVNGETTPQTKQVYLMRLNLTAQQILNLFQHNTLQTSKKMAASAASLPSSIDLGMNGIPVLDQGKHGTCVTFANTAAIDALLGKGDYISQLCQLELGSYLEKRGYYASGWEGSFGPWILNQMLQFGIINKDNQVIHACSGVTEYPVNLRAYTGNAMSLNDYKAMSEDISDRIYWLSLLDTSERFSPTNPIKNPNHSFDGDKVLMQVKTALTAAAASETYTSRLTFAVILPVSHCYAGACAQFHKANDTWVLTNAIINDPDSELGGHEMVITGYDDNATVTDDEGKVHKGLLILRNSWGTDVGDNGTFYMTYDFFQQFVDEVQEIRMVR